MPKQKKNLPRFGFFMSNMQIGHKTFWVKVSGRPKKKNKK